MTDKEVIINGVDVSKCQYFENVDQEMGCSLSCCGACSTHPDCYFKQLKRAKRMCEELRKFQKYWNKIEQDNLRLVTKNNICKQALDDIEQIAQTGLKPICYKSNCSRCKCYDRDDCKAGTKALLLNYFDKNGNFVDGNDDFSDELDFLVEKERKSCNRAKPISQKILDIIHKAKDGE